MIASTLNITKMCQGRPTLTILRLPSHDKITLDDEILKTRSPRGEELGECEGADSGRPKALECFRIFAPGLNEDVKTRPTIVIDRLQK